MNLLRLNIIILFFFQIFLSVGQISINTLSNSELVEETYHQEIVTFLDSDTSKYEVKLNLTKRFEQNSRTNKQEIRSALYYGILYSKVYDFDKSFSYFNKCLENEFNNEYSEVYSDAHMYYAKVLQLHEQMGLAIEHINKSIHHAKTVKNESKIYRGNVELAVIYSYQEEYSKAIQLLDSALHYFQLNNYKDNEVIVRLYRASSYMELNELENATNDIDIASAICTKSNNKLSRVMVAEVKIELDLLYGNKTTLLKDIEEYYTLAKQSEDLYLIMTTSQRVSSLYENLGKIDLAYKYLKDADSLNRVYTDNQYLNSLEQIEVNNRLREEKQRVVISEAQKEIVEQNFIKYIFITLTISLIIILFLLLKYWKIKLKKSKQEEQIKKQKLEFEKSQLQLEKSHLELYKFKQQVVEKNQLLRQFEKELPKSYINNKLGQKLESLKKSLILTKKDLKHFFNLFEAMYPGFLEYINNKIPKLTENDRIMILLIVLSIQTVDQANMLGVSMATIRKSRYRLKLKIEDIGTKKLQTFINNIHQEYLDQMDVASFVKSLTNKKRNPLF